MNDKTVCIVGLGYVGLPLAEAFSEHLSVIGFDVDEAKIKAINDGNNKYNLRCSADSSNIR